LPSCPFAIFTLSSSVGCGHSGLSPSPLNLPCSSFVLDFSCFGTQTINTSLYSRTASFTIPRGSDTNTISAAYDVDRSSRRRRGALSCGLEARATQGAPGAPRVRVFRAYQCPFLSPWAWYVHEVGNLFWGACGYPGEWREKAQSGLPGTGWHSSRVLLVSACGNNKQRTSQSPHAEVPSDMDDTTKGNLNTRSHGFLNCSFLFLLCNQNSPPPPPPKSPSPGSMC